MGKSREGGGSQERMGGNQEKRRVRTKRGNTGNQK